MELFDRKIGEKHEDNDRADGLEGVELDLKQEVWVAALIRQTNPLFPRRIEDAVSSFCLLTLPGGCACCPGDSP